MNFHNMLCGHTQFMPYLVPSYHFNQKYSRYAIDKFILCCKDTYVVDFRHFQGVNYYI